MKARNYSRAEFLKLSPARQRVVVARDVLTWVKLDKMVPGGGYFSLYAENVINQYSSPQIEKLTSSKKLDVAIRKEKAVCYGCAKGCLMFSYLMKADGVPTEDYHLGKLDSPYISKKLSMFSKEQLDLIEDAYEGWNFGEYNTTNPSRLFFEKYENQADRLVAIMNNIIKNRGTFIP